jgi:hypothetical protein
MKKGVPMAFDESPEFGESGIKSRPTLRRWLTRHERALYAVTGVLSVIMLLLSARVLGPSFLSEPGGLDGCLANASGEPVTGTVRVGSITHPVYDDGCFFFAELSPGAHELTIETSDGTILKQAVEIVPGQAVELGVITLP